MKRIAENRYPHSATLFKFCKEALALRLDSQARVIDQDVGAILSYDPADCSHWKKGKKNIRSLTTLKNLANYLQIDETLLIELASGKIDLEEAVFEFKGYGSFSFQKHNLENFKPFEDTFRLSKNSVAKVAEILVHKGSFDEAPVYLPEVFKQFKNIDIIHDPNLEKNIKTDYMESDNNIQAKIYYRDAGIRPYTRFLMAKELFFFLCKTQNSLVKDFVKLPEDILDVQANIFAGSLLIPGSLLRKEVDRLDSSFDIISQLTRVFWVSKALMSKRLSDYMDRVN